MNRSAEVVPLFRQTHGRGTDGARDVVVPGRKPEAPSADPWRHDHAGNPLHAGSRAADHRAFPDAAAEPPLPATVHGEHHTGLLRVRLAGDGGDIGEYDLDVQQALHLSQRLRDAATAMKAFLDARPPAFGRISG